MASGTGGIQFNGDTAAANALDDYEEGDWTPTFAGATTAGTATYNVQEGKYIKVGNMVTCWVYIVASSGLSGSAGTLQVNGLPFTAASSPSWFGHSSIGYFSNWVAYGTNTDTLKVLGPQNNTTHLRFHCFNNATVQTNPTGAQIQSGSELYAGCSYRVA
jgi:hypothetical protein